MSVTSILGKAGRDCRGQHLSVKRDIKSFNQAQGL